MHTSSQESQLPLLRAPDFLCWYVAGDGVILSSDGTAAAPFAAEIDRMIGRDYREALAASPGAVRRIERALAGESVAEFGDTFGVRWFNLVVPSACGWGVDGWSVLLPAVVGEPARHIESRRRTWHLASVPESTREPFRAGDVFVKIDGMAGVALGRHISDAEFLTLHMEHGPAMRLTSDSTPLPARRLRLLP